MQVLYTLNGMAATKQTYRLLACCMMFLTGSLFAQIPAGYYNSAIGKSGYDLQVVLSQIIGNHIVVGYDELWYYYAMTDLKPDSTIWDIYTDPYCSFSVTDHGATGGSECETYNREHLFCQSWFGATHEPPFSDLHHIFPVSSWINSTRNNNAFGEVSSPNRVWQNGSRFGPNSFTCLSDPTPSGNVFEPIDEFKGDIARAFFYMATRYMFEDSNFNALSPMTLKSQLRPWALEMLKNWALLDPVSQKETDRNNAIYLIQHNRNPYIDYPQLVNLVWGADSANFTFDPEYVPVSHLHINHLDIPTTQTIVLSFDTLIVPASVAELSNYSISNGILTDSARCTQPDEITLYLHNGLTPGYPYYIIVRNVQSASGHFLQDTSITFVYGYSNNHKPLISWTFDETEPRPNTPKAIEANINGTHLPATIYLDGTNGSSDFMAGDDGNQITTYPGTLIGDPRVVDAYDGRALAILGSSANGQSLVLRFTTEYWENLIFTFATRRTPTGYYMHTWEYSINGEQFDTLYNIHSVADSVDLFELKTIDLQNLPELERTPYVYLRLTIDGTWSTSGNNRFDNFTLYAQKCTELFTVEDSIARGLPYERYGFALPIQADTGSFVFSRIGEREADCDSNIVLNLRVFPSSVGIDEPQTQEAVTAMVYPNPATGNCTVKLVGTQPDAPLQVSLYDPVGRQLIRHTANPNPITNEFSIPLNSIQSGIYFLSIENQDFHIVKKIIIKNKTL